MYSVEYTCLRLVGFWENRVVNEDKSIVIKHLRGYSQKEDGKIYRSSADQDQARTLPFIRATGKLPVTHAGDRALTSVLAVLGA